ncbi:MAG: haloacid dehalogenase type II [Burkholderiaceae bacterium]
MSTASHSADGDAIRVLAFDVFGTVVDWRGSIINELSAAWPLLDAAAMADAWRAGYQPAMAKVRGGQLGWTKIDDLHRGILEELLPRFGLEHLDEAERRHLNRVWHRLDPWPDSVAGLERMRERFILTPMSNGNIGLLTEMAKRAGLPWDCVLSAEVFRHYKPDPETYLGVCDVFDIAPSQMLMVAAHVDDLVAAGQCGCRTAFVARPLEYGPDVTPRSAAPGQFDFQATDMVDLAAQLERVQPEPYPARRRQTGA